MKPLTPEEKLTHNRELLKIDIKEKQAKVDLMNKIISKSQYKKVVVKVYNEKQKYIKDNKLVTFMKVLYKEWNYDVQ
jgi:hypothetical protein